MTDGKGIIARIEAQEKERTGIQKLKVGYNRVFGYYIEISRTYTGEVPDTYIRKQTLANAERYITQELKELEARVLGARDRVVELEYQIFGGTLPRGRPAPPDSKHGQSSGYSGCPVFLCGDGGTQSVLPSSGRYEGAHRYQAESASGGGGHTGSALCSQRHPAGR